MAKRKWLTNEDGDMNMMPLMNIIMLLIPFLLMSSKFITIGVINTTLPKIAPPIKKPLPRVERREKPSLKLTIAVTHTGFTLLTQRGRVSVDCRSVHNKPQPTATIPKLEGVYNYHKLKKCVTEIKRIFPREERANLLVDPKVIYQDLVKVMDTIRKDDSGKLLFPQVTFSFGIS